MDPKKEEKKNSDIFSKIFQNRVNRNKKKGDDQSTHLRSAFLANEDPSKLSQSTKSSLITLINPLLTEEEKKHNTQLGKKFFTHNALSILVASINITCLSFFFREIQNLSFKKKFLYGLCAFASFYNLGMYSLKREKKEFDEGILRKYRKEFLMAEQINKEQKID